MGNGHQFHTHRSQRYTLGIDTKTLDTFENKH